MAGERFVVFESLLALVALEWFFPSVLPRVFLQLVRSSTSIVALVTFERLFTGVLSHNVFPLTVLIR